MEFTQGTPWKKQGREQQRKEKLKTGWMDAKVRLHIIKPQGRDREDEKAVMAELLCLLPKGSCWKSGPRSDTVKRQGRGRSLARGCVPRMRLR